MCFGPELALLAASTAASVGGSLIANNESSQDAQRMADARNRVLASTLKREHEFSDQNKIALNQALSDFKPQNQQATAAEAVEKRTEGVTGNQVAPPADASDVPLAGNAPKVIKGAIASRMLDAFNKSTDRAKATAQAGSYTDVFGANNRTLEGAGRNIDTTNGFSRSWASLMPSLQDLAAYSAHQPSSGIGQLLQGLGMLGAGYAGFKGGGLGNMFYSPAAAAVPLPPIRPV